MNADEKAVIEKCRQGDIDAFQLIYEKYAKSALRSAYLITGQRELAEDIVQEAFIRCFSQIKGLKSAESFPSWFYRLLVRLSWRMSSRDKNVISIESLSDEESLPSDTNLSEEIEKRDTNRAIYSAVTMLSKPLRTTVILHYFNGLSIDEIRRVLGCRPGTVKSRLHNARKKLEKILKEKGFTFSLFEEIHGEDEKNIHCKGKESEVGAIR